MIELFSPMIGHHFFVYNILITVLELVLIVSLILVAYGVLSWGLRFFSRFNRLDNLESYFRIVAKSLKAFHWLLGVILFLAILGFNSYLTMKGVDLKDYTLGLINKLPDDFFSQASIAVGKIILMLLLIGGASKLLDKLLTYLENKAINYRQIKENDISVSDFFQSLRRIKNVSMGLLAVYLTCHWLSLPDAWVDSVLLILKVYLVVAIGLLVVRAIAAIVDSLNALSERYAKSNNSLAFYEKLQFLIPLFRRSLEYIVYVAVATLVLELTDFVPSLAKYGPGIIQAIGLIFIARVVIEIINILLEKAFIKEGQSEEERQKNLTIVPLIKSVLSAFVYFIALVLILKGIGFDPVPLLAGAGIMSMVIGFGAQPVINDLLSGFFVVFEGQYKVGDFIEVAGARGVVERITLRITAIRNPDGQMHILRNGEIKEVVNFSHQFTHAVVNLGLDPSHNLGRVYDILQEIGEKYATHDDDVLEPTVVVGVENIDSPEIIIRTVTKVKPGRHLKVTRALRRTFIEELDKAGMGIPFEDRSTAVVVAM